MATVTLKGNPFQTVGELPAVGSQAPDFTVTGAGLADVKLADFAGSRLVLNIFPSVDTPTCATSVRKFNQALSSLENTKVLCISADLPFAQARFCGAEGLESVMNGSTFRSAFGADYGVSFANGPLAAYCRAPWLLLALMVKFCSLNKLLKLLTNLHMSKR